MVVIRLGVVKFVPVPKLGPPVAAEYQLIVPAEAVAPNVTVPGPHRDAGVVPVMVPEGFTVTVSDDGPGLVPQPLTAITEIFPPVCSGSCSDCCSPCT